MKCRGIYKCENKDKVKHTQDILKRTIQGLEK